MMGSSVTRETIQTLIDVIYSDVCKYICKNVRTTIILMHIMHQLMDPQPGAALLL